MGGRLTPQQLSALSASSARYLLFDGETQKLTAFFGAGPFESTWNRKARRMSREMHYIVEKFKLGVRHLLAEIKEKEAVPPKDYKVYWEQRSHEEREHWEHLHPDVPCPPHRRKKYFRDLQMFGLIARSYFAKNPKMTAQQLIEIGGGSYGDCAEEVLTYLRSIAKK